MRLWRAMEPEDFSHRLDSMQRTPRSFPAAQQAVAKENAGTQTPGAAERTDLQGHASQRTVCNHLPAQEQERGSAGATSVDRRVPPPQPSPRDQQQDKWLKRMAYGYRDVSYFLLKVHQHCGRVNPSRFY